MKALTALTLCTVLSAAPATIVAASNGYFDSPPPQPPVTGLAPNVKVVTPEPQPQRIVVPEVVVTDRDPAPKRVAYRGPRACESRTTELYGSKVRICGRPATPITHRKRSATELSKHYR